MKGAGSHGDCLGCDRVFEIARKGDDIDSRLCRRLRAAVKNEAGRTLTPWPVAAIVREDAEVGKMVSSEGCALFGCCSSRSGCLCRGSRTLLSKRCTICGLVALMKVESQIEKSLGSPFHSH